MNADFVKSLGRLVPPKFSGGNSITVSRLGLTAVLNGDGSIKLANLRKGNGEYIDLKVDNVTALELQEFSSIEFDSDGSLLLLWSSKRIGLIEISSSILKSDGINVLANDASTFSFICDDVNSGNGIEQASIPIVKACFHPLNSRHVVVLSEKELLRIVDIRTMETKQHRLSPDLRFSSFAFGPDIDWMKFALFLLTVKGDVYALCPIIPDGTLVSRQTINDLWAWADDHSCSSVDSSGVTSTSRDSYVESVRAYLERTLGPPKDEDESHYVRAGEGHISDWEHDDFPVVSGFATSGTVYRHRSSSNTTSNSDVSSHSLLLQGPLRVERGYHELSASSTAAPPSLANDICVPVVRGVSENRGIAAPVLVISRSSGEVEFLLMDTQSSSGGFVGPGWRPIDRHLPHLGTPYPDLLLVETIQIDKLIGPTSAPNPVSVVKDVWKLIPDPVLSHYFHVTNYAKCQSFLLSSAWLHTALMEVDTSCRTIQGSSSCAADVASATLEDPTSPSSVPLSSALGIAAAAGGAGAVSSRGLAGPTTEDADTEKGPFPEASCCIPVFIVNGDTVIDSKAVAAGSVSVTGLAVVSDPFLGHIALFRTSSGLVSAVNLTVHTKLCELQASLEDMSGSEEISTIKSELNKATSEESIRWRHSQQLILKIVTGLKNMPVIDNNAALTAQSSAQNKKFLVEAAEALERNVIVPMNELSQSTLFHYDILKETLKSQMIILEGKDALSGSAPGPKSAASAAAADDYHLSQGLKSLLGKLQRDHDLLVERVKAISDKLELQKQVAESQLSLAVNQRAKLTRAEVLYNKQLKDWSTTIAQMSKHIETLKQLTKPAMKLTSASLAGLNNGSTPVKSGGGGGVGGTFSSPAGSTVLATPPGTQQSVLYPGSTLGTYGGSVGIRTAYNTPGRFTGGFRSASSTPFASGGGGAVGASLDITTTPSKYLAGVSAVDSPVPSTAGKENLTSGSASNVTSTPQPPAVTRQFFQSPGAGNAANTTSKLLSLQSPAPYRRPGAATGPTAFRQGAAASTAAKSGAVDISTAPAPAAAAGGGPILNEGDQIACRELLGAQTELLKESEERLRALEERFKSLLNNSF